MMYIAEMLYDDNNNNAEHLDSRMFSRAFGCMMLLWIGHLHDGVILLLRPESFSFFLSYLNLVIPVRFK